MSLWLHHRSHLNGGGMLCDEKSARLESSSYCGVVNHGGDTLQTIRVFQNVDWKAAKRAAAARPSTPIGKGKFEGDTLQLGNHTLTWSDQGHQEKWEISTPTTSVVIEPEVDRYDANHWLDTFAPLQKGLFDQKLLGNRQTIYQDNRAVFELGGDPYCNHGDEIVAEAIESCSLIKFPVMPGSTRLKAVCLEEGTTDKKEPIRLEAIILHEIGHLLEISLSEHIELIAGWVEKDLHKLEEVLTEISPHYLKFRQHDWQKQFDTIESGGSIKIHGERMKGRNAALKLERQIAHEIFAEAIRHYFLEPQLLGYQLSPPKTGWKDFDSLCWMFCREVRYITRTGEIPRELFPKKRRKPHIIPEFIQDWCR